MSSKREQIVAAVVTALGGGGKPAAVPAPVRTRIDSPDAEQLPALTVYQLAETVEPERPPRPQRSRRGPIVRRQVEVAVEVLTKASETTAADEAADAALVWATQALRARTPTDDPEGAFAAFGDLADEVDELATKFEYEMRGETAFCRATQTWRIEYQTLSGDPEQTT